LQQESPPPVPLACRALAGLDLGARGGALALALLAAHSVLAGEFWWAKWNLAAAPFFGGRVFYTGVGLPTLTGAATLLLCYALVGGLSGPLLPRRKGPQRWLALLLLALALEWLSARYFWRTLHPFAPSYFTPLASWLAHLGFCSALLAHPRRAASLAEEFWDIAPSTPPEDPTAPPEALENGTAPPAVQEDDAPPAAEAGRAAAE
jgi:hypothetical protein